MLERLISLKVQLDDLSPPAPPRDAATLGLPSCWAGEKLAFRVCVFTDETTVDSLSGITSASITLQRGAHGPVLANETVASGAFDLTTDETSWNDGSKEQILFAFSAAEIALLAVSYNATQTDYWMRLTVTDGTTTRTLVAGTLTVCATGA